VESFLSHAGYGALVLFAFVEACCVPIPSEITFGFAGFLVYEHRLSFVAVLVIGTLAELAGSLAAYGIGRFGGRPLVERVGRYVLLTNADLDRAERWLSGRGEVAVLVGRAMPILRSFTSVVAGIADMPAVRFGVLSLVGTACYVVAVTAAGRALGSAWHSVVHGFSLAGYVLVALAVVAIAAFVGHRLRTRRLEREEASAPLS
jgi:membrane protein DedA with SNARE-associated domain